MRAALKACVSSKSSKDTVETILETPLDEKCDVRFVSRKEIRRIARWTKQDIQSTLVQYGDTLKIGRIHAQKSTATSSTLPSYLLEFSSMFDERKANRLPPYQDEFAMDIELLQGQELPKGRTYKLSLKEERAHLEELEKGLASGKIRRSQAIGACPVLFVKKADGSLRMCIDYRALNAITKSIRSSLPFIQDLLEIVGRAGSNRYSKYDKKGAFNLMRVKKGKEYLTVFMTKFGTLNH